MKKISRVFLLAMLSLLTHSAFAQDAQMADGMRANGKIYVVVGIILIVLIGLVVYLFMTDKKLTRLEQQLNQNGKPKGL
jgi:flagellar biosynthesis/type III secretory pathway M-ring protein FliF/YscJ